MTIFFFLLQSTTAAQIEIHNYSKKYCMDLRWEGNIKTGPFGTLIEYPALKNIRVCQAQNGKK